MGLKCLPVGCVAIVLWVYLGLADVDHSTQIIFTGTYDGPRCVHGAISYSMQVTPNTFIWYENEKTWHLHNSQAPHPNPAAKPARPQTSMTLEYTAMTLLTLGPMLYWKHELSEATSPQVTLTLTLCELILLLTISHIGSRMSALHQRKVKVKLYPNPN